MLHPSFKYCTYATFSLHLLSESQLMWCICLAFCILCYVLCIMCSVVLRYTCSLLGSPPFFVYVLRGCRPFIHLMPMTTCHWANSIRLTVHLALPSSSCFLQGRTLAFCSPRFMPAIIAFHQAFWILRFFQQCTQSALSCCVYCLPWAKPSLLHGMLSRPPLEQLPLCSQQMCQSSIAHSELRQTFVHRLAAWSRLHNLLP